MSEPAFTTVPTDLDLAHSYEAALRAALGPVVQILNDAQAHGLQLSFQVGRDQFGRHVVTGIGVVRPLL